MSDAPAMSHARPHGASPESEVLHTAAAHCNAAFSYGAKTGKVNELQDLLCLIDCASLLLTTAGFVAREAPYAGELRLLCLQQVKDILEVLAGYPDDEVMLACAAAVREAEDALLQHTDGVAE